MAREITNVLAGFSLAVVAAAILFAWAVNAARVSLPQPGTDRRASSAAMLFDRHCGNCHDATDIGRTIREAADPSAYESELESFLAGHGDASPADDRQILDYLRGTAGR